MESEEKSVQAGGANEHLVSKSIASTTFHDDRGDVVVTNDPEAGPIYQEIKPKNESEFQGETSSNGVLKRITNFAKKFNLTSSDSGGRQPLSSKLNALSALTTLACVILLCLYIVRSQATDLSSSPPPDDETHEAYYRNAYAHIPLPTATEETKPNYPWTSIQQLFESNADKNRLHIQVLKKGDIQPKHSPHPLIFFETHDKTLKISGRPNYCTVSDDNTPETVAVSYITHLHLSEMEDCHHYTKLILAHWKFPKVHHIKLHRMLIREQEFIALIKFIDRHNSTLQRVEIDECFLCPSPICDAGLINFPEHDFQITITRRRESPDWI